MQQQAYGNEARGIRRRDVDIGILACHSPQLHGTQHFIALLHKHSALVFAIDDDEEVSVPFALPRKPSVPKYFIAPPRA